MVIHISAAASSLASVQGDAVRARVSAAQNASSSSARIETVTPLDLAPTLDNQRQRNRNAFNNAARAQNKAFLSGASTRDSVLFLTQLVAQSEKGFEEPAFNRRITQRYKEAANDTLDSPRPMTLPAESSIPGTNIPVMENPQFLHQTHAVQNYVQSRKNISLNFHPGIITPFAREYITLPTNA